MSLSWRQRKARLCALLTSKGDENADGTAVDRLMHGQSVIGKTAKTSEIDALRFQDKDLQVAGTLEYGQFGVIDVVTCRLNNRVYVRKSIEKNFALRTREQCSPQTERDILLQASLTDSPWAPHLLAAYQMPTHLHLVMDYAEGGTLWDVLESSPHDGKILESDLRWWAPQVISAVHWCHTQGFAHRDIKPHNFVLTKDAHILLIDFGSAAPLLPPGPDGTQRLPKQYCLVPCGTCDYISPEILRAHEEALVALEMEDEDDNTIAQEIKQEAEGYGMETDWWSLGAMLYEMVYGAAPFFANEIRHTYQRIMNHEKSLRFPGEVGISSQIGDLLQGLLTHAENRLGRRNILEITDHPFFEGVNWASLPSEIPPSSIHLPQFTYTEPKAEVNGLSSANAPSNAESKREESYSQGFAFSALFHSTRSTTSPSISILRSSGTQNLRASIREDPNSTFIGFSWGPTIDAFPDQSPMLGLEPLPSLNVTPAPFRTSSGYATPALGNSTNHFLTPGYPRILSTPLPNPLHFMTPVRAYAQSPMQTIQRTSTIRRTAARRTVSDREAMKQLVDCIGMSARKKVLESGRKPRILTSFSIRNTNVVPDKTADKTRTSSSGRSSRTTHDNGNTNAGTLRKELRFFPTPTAIPMPDYNNSGSGSSDHHPSSSLPKLRLAPLVLEPVSPGGYPYSGGSDMTTESEGPPSPSPTPRPGSAMSISRRSGTPTLTLTTMSATFSQRLRSLSGSSVTTGTGGLGVPPAPWSAGLRSNVGVNKGADMGNGSYQAVFGLGHAPRESALRRMPSFVPDMDVDEEEDELDGGEDDKSRRKDGTLWEDLAHRHKQIMLDIDRLAGRLEEVSRKVSPPSAHRG